MSTGYYQKNKEKLQKEAHKRHENISEESKNKNVNILVKSVKVFLKMKTTKKREYCRK